MKNFLLFFYSSSQKKEEKEGKKSREEKFFVLLLNCCYCCTYKSVVNWMKFLSRNHTWIYCPQQTKKEWKKFCANESFITEWVNLWVMRATSHEKWPLLLMRQNEILNLLFAKQKPPWIIYLNHTWNEKHKIFLNIVKLKFIPRVLFWILNFASW